MKARFAAVVPLWLCLLSCRTETFGVHVMIQGEGTVVSSPSGILCPGGCDATLPSGDVELTALPDSQSRFQGWSGGCDGTSTVCKLTPRGSQTAVATFVPRSNTATLTVIKAAGSLGSIVAEPGGIDCGPTCEAAYPLGSAVTLKAVPDDTEEFIGWAGDCSGTGTCHLILDGNRTVVGSFASPAQIIPARATVTVGCGSALALKATGGQPPYKFTLLSGPGSVDAGTGAYTVPLTTGTAVVRVTDMLGSVSDSTIGIALPPWTSWSTVDDFAGSGPGGAILKALAADTAGNLYALGNDGIHWIVRKSQDEGMTWSTVDDFVYPGAVQAGPIDLAADSQGNVYVTGWALDSREHSVIRKGTSGGSSWSTVDDFFYDAGRHSQPTMLGIAPGDGVFVGHQIQTNAADDSYLWLVRSSTNHGATWSVSDSLAIEPVAGATHAYGVPTGFAADAGGNEYVAGSINDGKAYHWTVRKSGNAGSTWSTVDDYVDPDQGPFGSYARSAALSPGGRLYVAGLFLTASGQEHWVVRMSTDGGASWGKDDDYAYASTAPLAEPARILADASGRIYACGRGAPQPGADHWIVRWTRELDTWSIDEDFTYPHAKSSGCAALAVTSAGTHFAGGTIQMPDLSYRWVVRKETPFCF